MELPTVDFGSFLNHPLVEGGVAPFVACLVLVAFIRLIGGAQRGAALASLAIGLAFLAAYAIRLGLPPFPPAAPADKLFYVVAGATAFGFALDLGREARPLALLGVALVPAAALAWLALPRSPIDVIAWPGLVTLILAWAGGTLVLYRLYRASDDGLTPSVMALVAALGIAAVAFYGASSSSVPMASAAAGALAGFVVWNWPVHRYRFGAAALFGGGGLLVSLAGYLVLFNEVRVEALALLLPLFFADTVVQRVRFGSGPVGQAARPVVLGLLCLVPVALAAGLARWLAGGGP